MYIRTEKASKRYTDITEMKTRGQIGNQAKNDDRRPSFSYADSGSKKRLGVLVVIAERVGDGLVRDMAIEDIQSLPQSLVVLARF